MPSIIISKPEVADTPKYKQKKLKNTESMDLDLSDDSNSEYKYESYDTAERKKKEKRKKVKVEEDTKREEVEKKKKKVKKENKRKSLDGSVSEDYETVKRVKLSEEEKEAKEVATEEENPNALSNFRISDVVEEKLRSKGIASLFPIQAMTYDIILDGSDLVGRARTGQGKTLAFVLPILESLTNGRLKSSRTTGYGRTPTVVVLLPTRELAKQVHADFEFYGAAVGLSACSVYGGTPMRDQQNTLKRGVDVIVGTPGRIKDLINRDHLVLKALKFRVLDEADEMLNMGFVDDVEFILGKVEDVNEVQTLLFSATMPDWVKKISVKFLKADKKTVDLVGNEKLKASASVRHLVMPCSRAARPQLIPDIIRCYSHGGRTIIFAEKKESASELAGLLPGAHALHGDVAQSQREGILAGFRKGKFLILVATNVAARGLDINDVQLVIQCEPPRDVEAYIHRSGRTGRAGNTGISVLLYELKYSRSIFRIERESGVQFEHISAPQPADVAESAGSEAADSISCVSDSVISIFKPQAEQLLSSTGLPAIDLLAKALANAAGYTDIKKRSLLSSMENYVTLLLQAGRKPIYSPTFAYSILKRFLPEEKVEGIKGLSLTADEMGAVFDVPSEDLNLFMDGKENASQVTLDVIKKIPPLQEKEQSSGRFGSSGGWRGGGVGNRFGGGGRGSGGSGRGGGRGGFRFGGRRS